MELLGLILADPPLHDELYKSRTLGQLYETLLRRSLDRGFVTRFSQGLGLFEKRRLIGEDLFGKREEGFRASATSQKSRGHVQRIANEVPQFIADLARIHIFVAQRRKAIFGKIRRSEERRVGKACVSTCRSRGWP